MAVALGEQMTVLGELAGAEQAQLAQRLPAGRQIRAAAGEQETTSGLVKLRALAVLVLLSFDCLRPPLSPKAHRTQ